MFFISIFKDGEFTESVGSVYDISNIDRLGSSEIQQVQCVIDGVNELIQLEKCLEKAGNYLGKCRLPMMTQKSKLNS